MHHTPFIADHNLFMDALDLMLVELLFTDEHLAIDSMMPPIGRTRGKSYPYRHTIHITYSRIDQSIKMLRVLDAPEAIYKLFKNQIYQI